MFDVLIIGGGVSGMSCALVLGSAHKKAFAAEKKIGIFTHQKNTSLQEALFNNAYGIAPGKLGTELMAESIDQLSQMYPHVAQMENEKVMKIEGEYPNFTIVTNKSSYQTRIVVVAVGWANTLMIEGLEPYIEKHLKSIPEKNRIQLKNVDHKVTDGIYVAGTLSGKRSQLAIAAGSGAEVATDILTLWNNGNQSQSHDSIK